MFLRVIPFVDSGSLGSSIFLDAFSFISDVSFNSWDFLDTSVSSAKFRLSKELSANFSFLSYTDILWESDCFSIEFPYRLFSLA